MKTVRLPRGLGGGCRARVIELLASSPPQPVSQIAKALRLSYMGVKSQCAKLERAGYLASCLQRRERGRPEVRYRLTPKGRALFPQGGMELSLALLEHTAKLCGAQVPQKVLFSYFTAKGEFYASSLTAADLPGRLRELAALRTAEGHFSRCESDGVLRLIEGHSPLSRLFEKYPAAVAFETAALAKALGVSLHREEGQAGESIFFPGVESDEAPVESARSPKVGETPAPVPDCKPAAREHARTEPDAAEEPFRLVAD